MLRAAATAAWIFLPAVGYLLGVLIEPPESADSKGTDGSTYSSTSARSTRSSSRMPMIYSSKSALPSEWDKRQVIRLLCHVTASSCHVNQMGVCSVTCPVTQQLHLLLHEHAVGQRTRYLHVHEKQRTGM
jgi:hypothetical protein